MNEVAGSYQPVLPSLSSASEIAKEVPRLFGFPSGVEGLDTLFYKVQKQEGTLVRIPLGGYPSFSAIHITGIPETGKSLMAQQFAIKQASLGYPIAFVTIELPKTFLVMGLQQRAEAMGISFDEVKDRIFVLDGASYPILRENIPSLLATLEYALSQYRIKSLVFDSLSGLYEAREMMARGVVREIYNFLKLSSVTALLISQKRSGHEEQTVEAAGGYAIGHILDATIVVSKLLIMNPAQERIYHQPIGSVLRLFRIDGCRVCGHDTETHLMEITPEGLVKIGPPLSQILHKEVTEQ